MADTLSTLAVVFFVFAALFLLCAIFFFVFFNIPAVISYLSGRDVKKSIAEMRLMNEKSGNKSFKTSRTNEDRGKITGNIDELRKSRSDNNENTGKEIKVKKISADESDSLPKKENGTSINKPVISAELETDLLTDEGTALLTDETDLLTSEETALLTNETDLLTSEETALLTNETDLLTGEETELLTNENELQYEEMGLLSNDESDTDSDEETGLLLEETPKKNGKLVILDEIVMIHTDEVI